MRKPLDWIYHKIEASINGYVNYVKRMEGACVSPNIFTPKIQPKNMKWVKICQKYRNRFQ